MDNFEENQIGFFENFVFSSFIIIATFCAKNGAKSQNVVLNKLHFCKEWHFLSNFGQNFEKISTSRFFVIISVCIFVTILVFSTLMLKVL